MGEIQAWKCSAAVGVGGKRDVPFSSVRSWL